MTAEPALNATRPMISPLTLDDTFTPLERFMTTLFFTALGIIMNAFFIATFFIEPTFNKKGNLFLACAGLADFMICSGIMPIISVILLSKQWSMDDVCYTIQFIGMSSTYIYSMCFCMTALETYIRVSRPISEYHNFMDLPLATLALAIFALSFVLAGIGILREYDQDYCHREWHGDFYYRCITNLGFHIVPCLLTILLFTLANITIQKRGRELTYRRSLQYEIENTLCINNLISYSMFVTCWLPYVIVSMTLANVSDRVFYYCIWLPMCRSVFPGFIYTISDKNFRNSYGQLFVYVFCKNPMRSHITRRHRRVHELMHNSGSLNRVHVLVIDRALDQRSDLSRHTQAAQAL